MFRAGMFQGLRFCGLGFRVSGLGTRVTVSESELLLEKIGFSKKGLPLNIQDKWRPPKHEPPMNVFSDEGLARVGGAKG